MGRTLLPVIRVIISAITIASLAWSCAPRTYLPPTQKVISREEGIASWYGRKFHGRKTSNGERYNMYGISAAHRTLPLGTIVRVTHVQNGRKLTVRINDRGPFVDNRIIDLSYGAAKRLGMVKEGVAPVIVEVFGNAKTGELPFAEPTFSVQVGSFLVRDNADRLVTDLRHRYSDVSVITFEDNRQTWYQVRVGQFPSREVAIGTAAKLQGEGHHTLVVAVQ
jgi:rare lipoprotein A